MNTKLELCYRDADNCKVFLDVIFEGEITDAQLIQINEKLCHEYGCNHIIAHQVGLPTIGDRLFGDGPDSEIDHAWTELPQFDGLICRKNFLTDDYATHGPVSNLVQAFVDLESWDEMAEIQRIGL